MIREPPLFPVPCSLFPFFTSMFTSQMQLLYMNKAKPKSSGSKAKYSLGG